MIVMQRMLFAAACLGILLVGGPALADQDSNVKFVAPGLLVKKPPPGLPAVKAPLQAWPRLDAGAALCRSEVDLERLAARRRGEPVDGPIGCQILRAVTPISIVQRKGPGKTEVNTTDPGAGGSGWTDVWLPEKAPPGTTSALR